MDESIDTKKKLVEQLMEQLNAKKGNKNLGQADQLRNMNEGRQKIINKFRMSRADRAARVNNPDDKVQNMGLGKLADPTTIFVRTFRWTINASAYPDITPWVQSITMNYIDKTMEATVFEDAEGHVHKWLMDIMAASCDFTINHFDGLGRVLYKTDYSGITLKDHSVSYDYNGSDVLTHKIKLSYNHLKRSSNLTVN